MTIMTLSQIISKNWLDSPATRMRTALAGGAIRPDEIAFTLDLAAPGNGPAAIR